MAGSKITMDANGRLNVPDTPIVPFIEGDGIGPDIWRAAQRVFDEAVKKAYAGQRKIEWKEVLAGEKAFNQTGTWLPDETVDAFRDCLVGIKGPLTTPVGGGIRSLNVALRQMLDLYTCLRPVRYFKGVPSPVKRPQDVDIVLFRENTEDIYAGIEFENGSPDAAKFKALFKESFPDQFKKIRFPDSSGIGLKPVSKEASERLVRAAIVFALKDKRKSLTLVHKGNIMKFTEGAFKDWGYALAQAEFRNDVVTERESWMIANKEANAQLSSEDNARAVEPGYDTMAPEQKKKLVGEIEAALSLWPTHGDGQWKQKLLINDAIADIALQQVLTRPAEFDVIATMNLNGDYISDALAAQVGGVGIAPGGNINYVTGHAIFEATHGTAPKYANQDKVNPGSVILSGEMLLRHLGWDEAAALIVKGMDGAIAAKAVTYDFARLMRAQGDTPTEVTCSAFASAVIAHY